jgi:hypothetical protein
MSHIAVYSFLWVFVVLRERYTGSARARQPRERGSAAFSHAARAYRDVDKMRAARQGQSVVRRHESKRTRRRRSISRRAKSALLFTARARRNSLSSPSAK